MFICAENRVLSKEFINYSRTTLLILCRGPIQSIFLLVLLTVGEKAEVSLDRDRRNVNTSGPVKGFPKNVDNRVLPEVLPDKMISLNPLHL